MQVLLRTSYVVMIGLLFAGQSHAEELNSLSKAEEMAGWRLLFDGKSADQWRNYRKEGMNEKWVVEQGVLTLTGKGGGDIITKDQYDFFELSIDFRISPEGNSGIMFRVSEEGDRPWHTGPEIQVQDNVDGHDPQKAGWLYQLYQPVMPGWAKRLEEKAGLEVPETIDATRPAGEWNNIYLRITENNCEVMMNGVSYYRFNIGSSDWDKRVAASKFSKFPNFGKMDQGHICLQDHGNVVSYRNIKIRKLNADGTAPLPVDGKLNISSEVRFQEMEWADWSAVNEQGKVQGMRPIILRDCGDGSGRLFSASQQGMIHVFQDDEKTAQASVFLDLREKVAPWKKANEEGFLGFAFHPDYKNNGYFFVYYTSAETAQKSIISRFQVDPTNPDKALPESEHIVMTIQEPFPNHNGGAIDFGPDGYLYISLGDGGSLNDPMRNAQNLGSLLGKILRIDVNDSTQQTPYTIPKDNPFVANKKARPEIFALGFRNPWRISFDRATGELWMADVGQNLWEEINIVCSGCNYGWSVKEAKLPFGTLQASSTGELVDPVWEYDHQVGRSITGGHVYRGKAIPELQGAYVYADYVTGKLFALKLNAEKAYEWNKQIEYSGLPILAFGEDAEGEIYYLLESANGTCLNKLVPAK